MLPIPKTFPPMEALLDDEIPSGTDWEYEPKWDGFRCLAFKDGDDIDLMSKAGKPLGRYFPDVVETLRSMRAERFVLDGELVIPHGESLSFDDLLMRIHPAKSRVDKLARETPATIIVFDILVDDSGTSLVDLPLTKRRAALETFARAFMTKVDRIELSPATSDLERVKEWLESVGSGLDGIIAKRADLPYQSGNRDGMRKIKQMRTADCVVGGFRYAAKGKLIGSMLLGLYGEDDLLHHVGFTSAIAAKDKPSLTEKLEKLRNGSGFTGRAPGGPSRWSTERTGEWEALSPTLVVEVQYDHFSGGRFRHGTSFVRWRPDKAPRQCTLSQVERESQSALRLISA